MATPTPDSYTGQHGVLLLAGRPPRETHALAGAAAAVATAGGGLTHHVPLAGAASGLASASGNLTADGGVVLPQDPADITTFSLTNPSSGSAIPFTIGMPFVEGDIAAADAGVSVVGATAQVTPKNYWPDGSLKFAVIAGTASLSAGTPAQIIVRRAAPSSGTALTIADLKTAMSGQACSIGAGAFGTVSWATTDWDSPFETWVSGHRMSSWTYRKPFPNDTHLVGWLEVRLYAGGAVEVLPWVENGMLMVAGPTNKAETYTFALGSTQRFSQALDICHHTRTVLINGTHTSYWLGATHDVVVKHEGDYLQATRAVPSLSIKTPTDQAELATLPASFAPFQQGNWPAGMGSGGYHGSIGLLPFWDALYLCCDSALTYKGVVFNGYSAGRYANYYRDESNGHRPARLSQHPMLNFREPAEGWATTPATSGTASPSFSLSHQPSTSYVAYLITGRRYFLDDVQFVASLNAFARDSTTREGGLGLFKSWASGNERHVAWCHRSLAHAISATPDADSTLKNEYRTQYGNNVTYYHDKYIGASNDAYNPRVNNGGYVEGSTSVAGYGILTGAVVGTPTTSVVQMNEGGARNSGATADGHFVGWKMYSYSNAEERTCTAFDVETKTFTVSPPFSAPPTGSLGLNKGPYWATTWMQDFIAGSWGMALDLQLGLGGGLDAKLDRLFAWKAQTVIKRLGGAGPTEFLWRDFNIDYNPVSPVSAPDWDGGTGPWYVNQGNGWGDFYTEAYSGTADRHGSLAGYDPLGPKVEGPLRTNLVPGWSSDVAPIPVISYALRHGLPGAERAYRRLTTDAAVVPFEAGMRGAPMWAVSPYPRPKWARGQQVGEWRRIPDSNMALCPPTTYVTTTTGFSPYYGYGGRTDAYCGLTLDTRTSKLWCVAGGGHADWSGNEAIYQDLRADAPRWIIHYAGSDGPVAHQPADNTQQLPRYLDGQPSSRHTYYGLQMIERHNRVITHGGSFFPSGAGGSWIEGFDISAAPGPGAWDALDTYPALYGGVGSNAYIGGPPAICKDPRTEDIYYVRYGGNIYRHTPAPSGPQAGVPLSGATVTLLTWIGFNGGPEDACAVDTLRNRIMHRGSVDGAALYDMGANTMSNVMFSGSQAAAVFNAKQAQGMVYVPHLDAFLFRSWEAGGTVYQINASTMETVGHSNFGGDTIPQQTGAGSGGYPGVYNKWQLVPDLRGVVYSPGASHDTWFLRLW